MASNREYITSIISMLNDMRNGLSESMLDKEDGALNLELKEIDNIVTEVTDIENRG